MITAVEFLEACRARGLDFVSGTPCSYLKPLINAAIDDRKLQFCDATNEGDAMALAAGSYAATGAPGLVMFQNSGLGNAVNAITSLNWPFRIPALVVVTHRGQPGGPADEPQHELMGQITGELLDTLRVPRAPFPTDAAELENALDRAFAHFAAESRPFALVMPHGAVGEHALKQPRPNEPLGERNVAFTETLPLPTAQRASRTEALAAVLKERHERDVIVATTGYTGRELYTLKDAPGNFYMVGSMGSASAFALGVALRQPRRRVIVADGDGAVLMRMGNLASVGARQPRNFFHLVLDNEAHDSTGGQATASRGVSFGAIAQACGYARAMGTDSLADLTKILAAQTTDSGPTLVHLRIKPGAPASLGRPKITPAEALRRLMTFVQTTE